MYNKTQTLFTLAMWAELGSTIQGSAQEIETQMAADLRNDLQAANEIGEWDLVWGPAVFQAPLSIFADNTMYVVKRKASSQILSEFVIAIAGTNPSSIFDWLIENTWLNPLHIWKYGSPQVALSPMIANGTSAGLNILQALKPAVPMPSAGTILVDFIQQNLNRPTRISVTGHSLGGALTCVVALWLFDTQKEWDSKGQAQIDCVPFAGPTAGNADFSVYFANSSLGRRSARVYNGIDVVPHVWHIGDIEKVPTLFDPGIPGEKDPAVEALTHLAIANAWFGNFQQIYPSAPSLNGVVNNNIIDPTKPIFTNFVSQTGFQHVDAYFDLLGVQQGPANLRTRAVAKMNRPIGGIEAFQQRLERRMRMEQP
jgi:Lipase (class 3)